MIVLGIETAGPRGSVALLRPDSAPVEVSFAARGTLGAELAPAIQRLLEDNGLGPDTPPDLVAVDTGPGSYTGLRIGLAAAKGLAFAWGRPLLGIPTVDALSAQAIEWAGEERHVLCALDASRGEVYAAIYTREPEGLRLSSPGSLYEPQQLDAQLQAQTLVVGDAAESLADAARGIVAAELAWPSAIRIAHLAQRRYLDGAREDALDMAPIYYRPNEAEEQRRKRNMKQKGKKKR
ncbi:MAG TPA: tRNA (adenosine(37)-N6)-threonylcarbamoyltransferase complex dimerization subunit type 1 TsaB [Planctomycetes bacterium]|nr:tRNA (adenosine(37)-N6)-threonylcarbamoyltransferase complex dimerization subunit type 1 TsaB [Planctomycetota bacterium]